MRAAVIGVLVVVFLDLCQPGGVDVELLYPGLGVEAVERDADSVGVVGIGEHPGGVVEELLRPFWHERPRR